MFPYRAFKDAGVPQGLWVAALLGLVSGPLCAQEVFHRAELWSLESRPTSMRIDDYDRDGRPDLAVSHESSGQVSVLLNDSVESPRALRFDAPRSYNVGLSPLFIASGDVDGRDGSDLLVVNSGSSTVSVLLNRGDGQFRLEGDFATGLDPRVAAVADFDRDGDLDVVSGNAKSRDLLLHLGDGSGGFDEAGRFPVGGNPHSIGVEDFDRDGWLDVVAIYANGPVGGIHWLAGRAGGSFAEAVRTGLNQDGDRVPRFLATGDFDQDGRPDAAVLTDEDQLLFYRPYDIGDVVTVADVTGKVSAMSLVSTTLATPDNQTVVVPNGSIWGGIITNITRRCDLTFGIGYEDDIDKAQKLLEEIVTRHPKVLSDPAAVIKLHELADSSVNFVCRRWTKT
jgi:hypothetical protein